MRAARIRDFIGAQGIYLEEVHRPTPGPHEILVAVKATGLNRADLLQASGRYPAPAGVPADIPGLEYAGEVAAVGDRVTHWEVGDRAMGLVAGGAFAEALVTHEREALAIPNELSFPEAAAIPEAFITAWDALMLQGGVTLGSRVLIHAVASGVGTAALQLCKTFGVDAIGTSRNANKLDRVRALLGLHKTILISERLPTFSAEVKRLSGGGVDAVLDLIGGQWVAESLESLAPQGTLLSVGLMAGATAQVPLHMLLGKRLRIQGTTLRTRHLEEKIALARAFQKNIVPLFAAKRLRPIVDAVLPIDALQTALTRMSANAVFGKLVLTW